MRTKIEEREIANSHSNNDNTKNTDNNGNKDKENEDKDNNGNDKNSNKNGNGNGNAKGKNKEKTNNGKHLDWYKNGKIDELFKNGKYKPGYDMTNPEVWEETNYINDINLEYTDEIIAAAGTNYYHMIPQYITNKWIEDAKSIREQNIEDRITREINSTLGLDREEEKYKYK